MSSDPTGAVASIHVERTFEVFAWRRGQQWYYSSVEPCPYCGKRHAAHGGGNGPTPDLAIGEAGAWSTHCLKGDTPDDICVLAYIDEHWRP